MDGLLLPAAWSANDHTRPDLPMTVTKQEQARVVAKW